MAWDFPHARHPGQFAPRLRPGGVPYELLYVGSLEKRKGVGDLIRAMGLLRERMPLRLNIIGTGRQQAFEAMVAAQNLGEHVRFLGRMANAEVFARMQQADAVVVPSRHAFPEGLPLTLYEALAARAPVIASDHPMFAGHLRHRETAMVFRSGDAKDLAAQIAALFADDDLYARLSRDGEKAWNHMQVDAKWGDILDRWVHGSEQDQAWCRDNSFAARMDRDSFDLDEIAYRDDLTAADVAGWDSLSNIRFMVAVEQEFGRRLSMGQWQGLKSLGDLVELLAQGCLAPMAAAGRGAGVLCLGQPCFLALSAGLGADQLRVGAQDCRRAGPRARALDALGRGGQCRQPRADQIYRLSGRKSAAFRFCAGAAASVPAPGPVFLFRRPSPIRDDFLFPYCIQPRSPTLLLL
ncbi:hypothetical protein E4T56_gene9519 [Termitomyces sp. T112]|nr:hypothetical protein E4T56_gene9519 [Termitomyces sp. T112]